MLKLLVITVTTKSQESEQQKNQWRESKFVKIKVNSEDQDFGVEVKNAF